MASRWEWKKNYMKFVMGLLGLHCFLVLLLESCYLRNVGSIYVFKDGRFYLTMVGSIYVLDTNNGTKKKTEKTSLHQLTPQVLFVSREARFTGIHIVVKERDSLYIVVCN